MGWKIGYNNSDWAAVYLNLHKSRQRWDMIERVIEITLATVRAREAMYKSVGQSVLLYGRESWVVTGEILKFLTAF